MPLHLFLQQLQPGSDARCFSGCLAWYGRLDPLDIGAALLIMIVHNRFPLYYIKITQRIHTLYGQVLKNPYDIINNAEHRKIYERNCGISQTHIRYDLRTQEIDTI